MSSWVVEAWNGIESSHFCSSCQVAWVFSISSQNKPCLAPHLILSDHSMCICCNEHGTIYAISSDFGDRMTTQSMGLMVLLSEHF